MNGELEKNLIPSEKNLIDGKKEIPLGTKLSKKIENFSGELCLGDCEEFLDIIRDMFALMKHHRYGVLFNVLKKFI